MPSSVPSPPPLLHATPLPADCRSRLVAVSHHLPSPPESPTTALHSLPPPSTPPATGKLGPFATSNHYSPPLPPCRLCLELLPCVLPPTPTSSPSLAGVVGAHRSTHSPPSPSLLLPHRWSFAVSPERMLKSPSWKTHGRSLRSPQGCCPLSLRSPTNAGCRLHRSTFPTPPSSSLAPSLIGHAQASLCVMPNSLLRAAKLCAVPIAMPPLLELMPPTMPPPLTHLAGQRALPP